MSSSKLEAGLSDQCHLPEPLRDFHAQKDVFKCIGGMGGVGGLREISWVEGHCYTIDKFLTFMARHGWTLQRSRKKVDFEDLDETIGARHAQELEVLGKIFAESRGG